MEYHFHQQQYSLLQRVVYLKSMHMSNVSEELLAISDTWKLSVQTVSDIYATVVSLCTTQANCGKEPTFPDILRKLQKMYSGNEYALACFFTGKISSHTGLWRDMHHRGIELPIPEHFTFILPKFKDYSGQQIKEHILNALKSHIVQEKQTSPSSN